jgi:hypothetical protein
MKEDGQDDHMGEGEEEEQQAPDLDSATRRAIKKLISEEDEVRNVSVQMKEVRARIKEHKQRILDWMGTNGVKKIDAKHGNQLMRKEKEVYIRPTTEQQTEKLTSLVRYGVTNPEIIMQELRSCAGQRTDVRLYRRRPRKTSSKKPNSKKRPRKVSMSGDDEDVDDPADVGGKPTSKKHKHVRFTDTTTDH